MKVKVNENCIGCGLCANMCPEVFEMVEGAEEHSQPITDADELRPQAMEAAEACPVAAIEVE